MPSIRREISLKTERSDVKNIPFKHFSMLTEFYNSDRFCGVLFTVTHTAFVIGFIFIGFIFH